MRPVAQRCGDCDFDSHAARKRFQRTVERKCESAGELGRVVIVPVWIESFAVREKIPNAHPIRQLPVLRNVSDFDAVAGGEPSGIHPQHFRIPGCRLEKIHQDLDCSRLPGPIRTQQNECRPCRDLESDAGQRVRRAKFLGELFCADNCSHDRACAFSGCNLRH